MTPPPARGSLVAIAGLKRPDEQYRRSVFESARVELGATEYELELGWVYVHPEDRGTGLGADLCRQLIARAAHDGVLATTRPDNVPMTTILASLAFTLVGRPFPHTRRKESLALFVRPAP